MTTRVHLIISGIVQGVSFRWSAREQARHVRLSGWIRNNDDGTVECVAEGEKARLQEFVAWCKRGSHYSRVVSCTVEWKKATGEFSDFEIRF